MPLSVVFVYSRCRANRPGRHGYNRNLHGGFVGLVKKVYVSEASRPSSLHSLAQLIGTGERACTLQTIPLEQDRDVVGVIRVAKDNPAFGAIGLADGPVLIEQRLPLVIVFD